ncbi:MAG: lysostaphin resistance A-like protein [Planctomycetaceae bacterium]
MDITSRRGFLNLAAVFEGATLGIGVLLGWWSGTLTSSALRFPWADVGWGVLAVVPMLSLLVVARDLRRQVREMMGAALAQCTWYDLIALALLAGLGEEVLFRGVLEPWIGRWDPWFGLLLANILFGLAHAVSPNYFLFAALIGVYFSLLNRGWPGWGGSLGQPNLLRPILAHALYDLIAFVVIVRDYHRTALPAEARRADGNHQDEQSSVPPESGADKTVDAVDSPVEPDDHA